MDLIFLHEGGYVDHPNDPGGATNMGITLATLARWRDHVVTKDDVKHLTRREASGIYGALYWFPIRGNDLPSGLDCSVMDFAVNAGVRRAVSMLQALVCESIDGVMGPQTLQAVTQNITLHGKADILITEYAQGRETYYRTLAHFPTFGAGWLRRTNETKAKSLALAQGG